MCSSSYGYVCPGLISATEGNIISYLLNRPSIWTSVIFVSAAMLAGLLGGFVFTLGRGSDIEKRKKY